MLSNSVEGYFGEYGGRYVPETLIPALDELVSHYKEIQHDEEFLRVFDDHLSHFVGRPTPLFYASRMSEVCGVQLYFKKRGS